MRGSSFDKLLPDKKLKRNRHYDTAILWSFAT